MDSQKFIPINVGETIKFPLHIPLILFMNNGKLYCCTIKYAGKDFVVVKNLQERIVTELGEVIYIDLKIDNQITFQRNRIDGFSKLEHISPINRPKQFKNGTVTVLPRKDKK